MSKTGVLNQPIQFSTKPYDEQTGLSYYGYRFYSPAIGRWITRDPLGETGGINLCGFAGNSPVNYIDPTGEVVVAPVILLTLFVSTQVILPTVIAIWRPESYFYLLKEHEQNPHLPEEQRRSRPVYYCPTIGMGK
jgi:RHS repeat-associated protein